MDGAQGAGILYTEAQGEFESLPVYATLAPLAQVVEASVSTTDQCEFESRKEHVRLPPPSDRLLWVPSSQIKSGPDPKGN